MNEPIPLNHDCFPVKPSITQVGDYQFVNYEPGMYAAMILFIRGVQAACKHLVFIKSWEQKLTHYNPPYESNRSGEARFALDVLATFSTSAGTYHAAFASLYLNGGDDNKFIWEPNTYGTCLCVDGLEPLSLECNAVGDGNIRLVQDGYGACTDDEFKEKVAKIPWKEVIKQAKQEY